MTASRPHSDALRLPAEWEPQSFVQIAWPHRATDWAPYLDEANACYRQIALEVARREPLVIVTPEPDAVEAQLRLAEGLNRANVHLIECPTNDTWARDHAFLTLVGTAAPDGAPGGSAELCDFGFNGWGMKFAADLDNRINAAVLDRLRPLLRTASAGAAPAASRVAYRDLRRITLEGGSVESDGRGTLLTTTGCLLAPNRNYYATKAEAEAMLLKELHAERVLWLDHGDLRGDDTDGHIDTLARLCPQDTIAYVRCLDTEDVHHAGLVAMERDLRALRTRDGLPYRLLPLPMPRAIHDAETGERLPATYANFLVLNNGHGGRAVLMPTYGQPDLDAEAAGVLRDAFPGFDVVGIDCRVLIRQHGSLHCVTMQYPQLGA